MTKRVEDLIQFICEGSDHPLAPLLRRWCDESRPFIAFAEAQAAKIRKKVRLALLDDERTDVVAELAIAALLVRDRRFTVLYEPHRVTGQRSPDFQVIFKTTTAFHVEVTRLRLRDSGTEAPYGMPRKLARVVCEKIGQLPSGGVNMLAVVVPAGVCEGAHAATAIQMLDSYPQRDADLGLPPLPQQGVRTFRRHRQCLSAIGLCSFTDAWSPLPVQLWVNTQTKHPLPQDVMRYLVQATGDIRGAGK